MKNEKCGTLAGTHAFFILHFAFFISPLCSLCLCCELIDSAGRMPEWHTGARDATLFLGI
jgi:hypothetical protein